MGETPRRVTDDADLDDGSARRAEEIRSEIAQTREEMSETIDAIQEKLRPGNIAAAATDRVKNATTAAVLNVAEAATATMEDAMESTRRIAGRVTEGGRGNAIAAAMIGIGSAWLLVNRWSGTDRRTRWQTGRGRATSGTSGPGEGYYRGGQTAEPWYREEAHDVGLSSGESAVGQGYERMSSMAHDAQEGAMQAGRRARHGFENLLESNPLMVGAAALAVGAAVGLALPETHYENEWLGETRDDLVERAQDMARSTATEIRQAAGEIAGKVASDVMKGEGE